MTMDMKENLETAKKITKVVLKRIGNALETCAEEQKKQDVPTNSETRTEDQKKQDIPTNRTTIVLDTVAMKKLRWMSCDQLKAIFRNKDVSLRNETGVWDELMWMSSDQLTAIFGNDIPSGRS